MRCLTLTEPWASLVAEGAKRVESRSWGTTYRGELAIHAGQKLTRDDIEIAVAYIEEWGVLPACESMLRGWPRVKDAFRETRGRVIAIATLVACVPTERVRAMDYPRGAPFLHEDGRLLISEMERDLGNYGAGRWAWVLADVRRLREPAPATGTLGLWDWRRPDDLATEWVGELALTR